MYLVRPYRICPNWRLAYGTLAHLRIQQQAQLHCNVTVSQVSYKPKASKGVSHPTDVETYNHATQPASCKCLSSGISESRSFSDNKPAVKVPNTKSPVELTKIQKLLLCPSSCLFWNSKFVTHAAIFGGLSSVLARFNNTCRLTNVHQYTNSCAVLCCVSDFLWGTSCRQQFNACILPHHCGAPHHLDYIIFVDVV